MPTLKLPSAEEMPQEEKKGIGIAPYAALFGGEAADIGSTLKALSNGAQEGNPVFGGSFGPKQIAIKAATAVPMALLMKYLTDHDHPTLAKVLGYGTGAGLGAVSLHNLTVK